MNMNAQTVTVFQKGKGRLGAQTLSLSSGKRREEKPNRPQLQVVRQSISDDEAIKRANMLAPEDQNTHTTNNRRKMRVVHNNMQDDQNAYEPRKSFYAKPAAKEKEHRVPGLYGCNRWKSNQPNKGFDSQESFEFF